MSMSGRRPLIKFSVKIWQPQMKVSDESFFVDEIEEIGITATELSRQIDVPPNRISKIIRGKRGLTADTALRLGKFFCTGPEFWINLQKAYELDRARVLLGAKLNKIHGWELFVRKAG